MRKSVIVRVQVQGWHHWPEAPEHRSYLRQVHHHFFRAEFEIEVKDEGREIEFHDLQKLIRRALEGALLNKAASCEMLARMVGERVAAQYPGCWWGCMVWENSECGARVTSD